MDAAQLVLKLLELIAGVAPKFLATFSGTETAAEAIQKAREALPDTVTPDWDADFARRLERVRERGQVVPE